MFLIILTITDTETCDICFLIVKILNKKVRMSARMVLMNIFDEKCLADAAVCEKCKKK